MSEIKWELPQQKERPIGDGDLRIVNLPVQVLFEWSDKIMFDHDPETGHIEYTSGFVMKVLNEQSFVFKDEQSVFMGSMFKS